MNNMKEIKRQSMYHEDEGTACGPCGVTSIDAEIVVEDNNGIVYLHGQWIDVVGDDIYYEATKESTYEIYKQLHAGEGDFDALIEERNRIDEGRIKDDSCYEAYYKEIKEMIEKEMNLHEIAIESDYEETFEN